MNFLLANTVLALIWSALTGDFSLPNLLVGFGWSAVALFIVAPALGKPSYFVKVWKAISLLGFFIKELIIANLRVAYDVITPGNQTRPGIIALPLDIESDIEITLLANLIALTPGTSPLEVSRDRKTMLVHSMFISDPDSERAALKNGFERRIKEVFS